jgi:ribosomal protein S18 acetylase RimI-like enzyme
METAITIRPATATDAPTLAELGRRTFIDAFGHLYQPHDLETFLNATYRPDIQAQELATPGLQALLAEDGATALGYVTFGPCKLPVSPMPDGAMEIRRLYVAATHQGRGIGAVLMEQALTRINTHAPLYIGVWEENHGAQRFYARYGFAPAGAYHFYVGGHADNEIILKKQ